MLGESQEPCVSYSRCAGYAVLRYAFPHAVLPGEFIHAIYFLLLCANNTAYLLFVRRTLLLPLMFSVNSSISALLYFLTHHLSFHTSFSGEPP